MRRLFGLFAFVLALTVSAQTDVVYREDFQTAGAVTRPAGWVDSSASTPIRLRGVQAGRTVAYSPSREAAAASNIIYGVKNPGGNATPDNPRAGLISTQTGFEFSGTTEYSGRFLRTSDDARIGVTLHSSAPQRNAYYLLGVWGSTVRLFSIGAGPLVGTSDTQVTPQPNQWYLFRAELSEASGATVIRARVWLSTASEPSTWTIEAVDTSVLRLRSGRLGVWSALGGEMYFDDLSARSTSPVTQIDTTAPAIRFTSPAANALIPGAQITAGGFADDAVTIVVNGVAATIDPATRTFTTGLITLIEGPNTLSAVGSDAAGNQGVANVSVVVDTRGPELSVTSPAAGTCIDAVSLRITGFVFDPSLESVKVSVDGAAATDATLAADKLSWSADLAASEGRHIVHVVATDAVGHASIANLQVTFDRTAPIIEIGAGGKTLDAMITNRSVIPSIDLADADVKAVLAVTLDGAAYRQGVDIPAEGDHEIRATATDCAGHTTTRSAKFTIDRTPPQLLSIAPAQATTVGARGSISGTVSPDTVSISFEPAARTIDVANGTFTIEGLGLEEGTNLLELVLTDRAGNVARVPYRVKLALTAPEVEILHDGAPIIAGTLFTNPVRPILRPTAPDALVTATLNGAAFVSGTTIADDGAYAIVATASDAFGHTSAPVMTSFTIDATAPLVKITTPSDGTSVNVDQVEVRGTTDAANGASINVSGINTNAAAGAFIATVPLDFGPNVITASIMDAAGNVAADSVVVTRSGGTSGIILTAPADRMTTNRRTTLVAGQILTPSSSAKVTIGATEVAVDAAGRFRSLDFALAEGENVITATLRNSAGETNQASVRVTADRTPPHLRLLSSDQPLADQARFADRAVITAVATDRGESVTPQLVIDGASVTQPATITAAGGHTIVATARDQAGNESRIERTIFIGTAGSGGCALTGFDPPSGSIITSSIVTLVGRCGGAAGVKVNGVPALVSDGSFCATVELPAEGDNAVTIVCTDVEGAASGEPVTLTLRRATDAPSIAIANPSEGSVALNETIAVTGTVTGATSVEINGTGATISGSTFTAANVRLSPGLNVIVARARAASGKTTTSSRRVTFMRDAGAIAITSPATSLVTGSSTLDVSGAWMSVDPTSLTVNGISASSTTHSDTTGTFVARVPLAAGSQTLTATARDLRGAIVNASTTVTLTPGSPSIAIEEPLDNAWVGASGDSFAVRGSFVGTAGSSIEVAGVSATIDSSASTFTATVPFSTIPGGVTPVIARITEPSGASSIDAIRVTRLATRPRVIEGFPAPAAADVEPGALPLVLFSAPMDRASLASAFSLESASGAAVAGTLRLERDVLTFAPSALLTAAERYTMRVSAAAKDLGGNAIDAAWSSSFTIAGTAPTGPPTLTGVPARLCAQQLALAGTAPANARLRIQLGTLIFNTTASATGAWTFPLSLSGQSGRQAVRVRIVGSDGALSPAAEACFAVDCAGPHVVSATLDRIANRIAIAFSREISPASANNTSITIRLGDGRSVGATIAVQNPASRVVVTPSENVATATLTLTVTTSVEDATGTRLAFPFTQTFTFESNEPPPPGDGTGFIAGEVFDANTGRPLSGATVTIDVTTQSSLLRPQSSAATSSSFGTDPRGRYAAQLPEGAHTIRIGAPGFTTAWRQIVVLPGAGLTPIDVRLRKRGNAVTVGAGALTVAHESVQLDLPSGAVASGTTITLTSLGGQTLPGLLPLGWSPMSAALVESSAPSLSTAQLSFDVPAGEITAASQTIAAAEYQQERDEWRVIAPSVAIANGKATLAINAAGTFALVYADRATGLAQPVSPVTGSILQGVVDPCASGCPPLAARSFVLDPPLVLPTGRTVATLKIEGAPPALFPSGTAVQAYIDEELRLADGTLVSDPPFSTDLLLYRTLAGDLGVAQFELAPSPKAAEVILEVGFDRIRILPYPGRLDRGTLVGPEGGKVPSDGLVSVDIPAGAASEPLRASATTIQDLAQFGTIAGFRIVTGFALSLQRVAEGSGEAPVELLASARVAFTQASSAAQHVVVEVVADTPFGRLFRLVAQTSTAGGRIATRAINRATLPLDGIVRDGRYLLLAAEAPIAFATGTLRIPNGAFIDDARITTPSLGTAALTAPGGLFAVAVQATPAAPFTLIPRMRASGDGAPYTHATSPAADAIVALGELPFAAQPPALTSTIPAAGAGNVALNTFVKASFSPAIDPGSIDQDSLIVTDAASGLRISGTVSTEGTTAILWKLNPQSSALSPNRTYTVTISSNVRGTNGAPFGRTHTFGFSTITQLTSTEVRPEKIRITIPDAQGRSRVVGDAGAIPPQWNAVAIRRGRDFVARPQATAGTDGSFTFAIPEAVALTDLIDLQVINNAGAIAAIIPLTPFASDDMRGFVAPSDRAVRFTTRDGIVVSIPAGTFDEPTIVTATPATKEAFVAVATFDTDLTYTTSVNLDFKGLANKRIQVELPLPAGADPSRTSYLLGRLGDTTRGPKIMIVETLRVANGRFTTELPPSSGNATAPLRARSTATLTGAEVKSFLNGVNRAGLYLVTEIQSAGTHAFAALEGIQAGYDLFVDQLQSIYAHREHLIEGNRVAVPVIVGKTFEIVGVDSTTGLQAFARAYDPLPFGDPGAAYILPTPSVDVNGPYPVFGTPFRIEIADIDAEDVNIETVRNFDIRLKNDVIRASNHPVDPVPANLSASMLNVTQAKFDPSRAGGLELAGAVGDRVVLSIEVSEVDPSTSLSIVFSEPIFLGGSTTDAEVDAFLHTVVTVEKKTPPQTNYTDISALVRYRSDSGRRRLLFEVSALERGADYRVSLSADLRDDAGLRIGQITPGGKLSEPYRLHFRTRAPGGKIASFDITSGQIRDTSLNGNVLLVAAMDGGLFAYDVADPASLNSATIPIGHAAASVVNYWSLASDHHGRIYATTQSPSLGGVQSFNLEDFLPSTSPHTTPSIARSRGGAVVSWSIGANGSVGVLSSTTLSDRPEGIPRKIQILLQDDEESFATRADFVSSTRATATKVDDEFDTHVVTLPMVPMSGTHAGANPYLLQRITIENQSLDLRWSADAVRGAPAVISGVIARAGDRIRILRNRTTYGVIAIFGYGIGVYDLNAIDSNDAPNRPRDYKPIRELVRGTRAAIAAPDMFRPTPCSDCLSNRWAIPDLTFTPDAAILTRFGKTDLHIFALDATRGVLDLIISPPITESQAAQPPNQQVTERGGDGLVFRGQFLGANGPEFHHHPRIAKLRDAFKTLAKRDPFGRFTGVARYHWRLEAQDNKVVGPPVKPSIVNADAGARGSIAGTDLVRDYLLIPANEYGLLVLEVAGNPPPIEIQDYLPLGDQHLADIIWIPSGAQSVRMIPRTNLAAVLDGQGRVLLIDLAKIDERFFDNGVKRPDDELFPTAARALSQKGTYGIGMDDPRIVWKSEPGMGSGTLAPLVDGDTGFLFASKPVDPLTGLIADRRTTVLAAVDPRVQMKVDIGAAGGLAEVGGIVPMGITPPDSVLQSPNGSLSAFRLEMSLPGAITESIPGGKIQVAVESERVFGAATEQTAGPMPRSHLRIRQRDGTADSRAATAFTMRRVVPAALAASLRHQRGFNKFISPWVVAIADPRASINYAWPSGTTAISKEEAGCFACERLSYLKGKTESDGVWELYTKGRIISVRPDLCSGTCLTNVFSGTPYSYLGERDRLTARFGAIIADTVREPEVLTAGHNPAVAGGAVQETLYLHSGEVGTSAVDLDAGGVSGWNVIVDRTYRSRTIGDGALGKGWDSGLMRRLRPLPTGDVEYRDGSGEIWLFKFLNRPGKYESPKGLFLTLTRSERGWRLLDQKWRITDFDQMGRMVSEADEYVINPAVNDTGNIVRYLYGTDGRLAQVIDPVGRATQVTWNDAGYISAVETKWRGQTINYAYDTEGRLKTVELPNVANTSNNRPAITYTYAPVSTNFNERLELTPNLATITDPGQTKPRITFNYGTGKLRDKLIGEKWTATGEDVTINYTTGIHIDVLDALKQKRSYTISSPSLDYTEDRPHTIQLEEHDVMTSKTPFGELPPRLPPINSVDRSEKRREFSFRYAAEDGLLELSTLKGVRTTTYTYEPLKGGPGRVLIEKATAPEGVTSGPKVVRVKVTYQQSQNGGSFIQALTSETDGSPALKVDSPEPHRGAQATKETNDAVTSETRRDLHGRPTKISSTGGTAGGAGSDVEVKYISDAAAAPHTRGMIDTILRPGLNPVQRTYKSAREISETDERNVKSESVLDAWFRPQIVTIDGPDLKVEESYEYDAAGLPRVQKRLQNGKTIRSATAYDALGRVTAVESDNIAVAGTAKTLEETTVYDLPNRKVVRKLPSGAEVTELLDGLGRLMTRTTTTGGTPIREEFAYDLAGNLVYSANNHTASATAYDVHGRAMESLHPDLTKTVSQYDAWGRATRIEHLGQNGSVVSESSFTFTPAGKLESSKTLVTAGLHRETKMAWDGAGRVSRSEVSGRAASRDFDISGRMTSSKFGLGTLTGVPQPMEQVSVAGHDGLLPSSTLVTEKLGAAIASTATFNTFGDAIKNNVGTLEWTQTFDQAGNVVKAGLPSRPEAAYEYDARGSLTKETSPDKATIDRQYDESGSQKLYRDQVGEPTESTNDDLGRPRLRSYADGTSEVFEYDGLHLLSHRDRQSRTFNYTWDDKGRLIEIRAGGGDLLDKYEYDDAGRLFRHSTTDAEVTFENFDFEGRPQRTTQTRLERGTSVVIDRYVQDHEYSIHGERQAWTMPSSNAFNSTNPWVAKVLLGRDEARNVTEIKRRVGLNDTVLLSATYRNAGRPEVRTLTTYCASCSPATIGRAYGYDAEGRMSSMVVSSRGIVIAGSDLVFDGLQIQRAQLLGLSNNTRANTYDYDDRSRLSAASFAREQGAVTAIESMTPADFRDALIRQQADPGDPPSLVMKEQAGHKIAEVTRAGETRTFKYNGSERADDGKWVYEFDARGRMKLMTEKIGVPFPPAIRRIFFYYGGHNRMVGRRAEFARISSSGAPPQPNDWKLEDRTFIVDSDGLPADTTFVWDPLSDQLVSVFKTGASQNAGIDSNNGLVRQFIHGGLGYDDPIEIAIADAGSGAVHRLYPIYDEAAAGSLQAVIGANGDLVSRAMIEGGYGEETGSIAGPAIDKIEVEAEKDKNGAITSFKVTVRSTEQIDAKSLATGARLAAVDAAGAIVLATTAAPSLADPYTIRWNLSAAEWTTLTTAANATAISVAVTNQLRATAWSAATTVLPPPDWVLASKPLFTSNTTPVEYRESLSALSSWLTTLRADDTRTATLYNLANLSSATLGNTTPARPDRLITVASFHAYPFQEPANGLIFARERWLDPSTGSFLTPDPMGYRDSSNLYALCGGDPVNCADPTGEAGIKETALSLLGWGVGVVESAATTVAHGAAMPITRATDAVIEVYTDAAIGIAAYQAGGVNAVVREAGVSGRQRQAESKENLLSMVPLRNTFKNAGGIIEAYEKGGSFEGGRQVGRTTFSLGLDATAAYGTVRGVQAVRNARATPAAPGLAPEPVQPAPAPLPIKRSGTTRQGVTRTNTAEWRHVRDLWDEMGYGDIISKSNREFIAKGRTPIVDDAWVTHFPGDAALMGEQITIHHIGGGKISIPLPKSRHIDAHKPGGFRRNPGGPGTSG